MPSTYWDRYLSTRLSRRRALAGTGATALGAALLVACGGGDGSSSLKATGDPLEAGSVWFAKDNYKLPDETKQAVRGGIYRGVMDGENEGHYDAIVLPSSQAPFSSHVHEMFMARSNGPGIEPGQNKAIGALAESWEISADGLTITYTMRPNVKWHPIAPVNGRVMDMDDWRSSQDRWTTEAQNRVSFNDAVDRYETPDARHMVWKMKYPFAPIFQRVYHDKFNFMVQPKELNANPSLAERTAIGTGYKILDKHQKSIGIEYRKHTEYWGGEPFIDRWLAPIIPEYANRYAQFVSMNIMDFTPTAQDVLLLKNDTPNAVIVANPIPEQRVTRLRFGRENNKTLPWKDVRVRVAIRRAIDFRGIGEFLSNKEQFERNGIAVELLPATHLPPDPMYWLNPDKGELGKLSENYLFSAEEAKKLTAAAGFSTAIPIDYWVEASSSGVSPEDEQLVMDSLDRSGVFKVSPHLSRSSTEHRNCRSLGRCDGIVSSGQTDDADYFIYRDYHSAGNTAGEQAYPDPRIDAVAVAQRQAMDLDKRIGYIKDFQMIAAELMPVVPFQHHYTSFRFRWPWAHNSQWGEGGSPPDGRPSWGSHLMWLDKDMPNRDKQS